MRLGSRVVERPELTLEVACPAPERAHQAERLVRAPAALPERHAHEAVLVLVPADADPEVEAAAAQLLQRGDLLRQVHRVVQRHEHDRGAEADPLRAAGDPAERDERVVDAAVRVDAFGSDDDVLGRPDGVVLELLRQLGGATDRVGSCVASVVRQDHTEVHDPRLTRARVARLATTDPDGRPHLVPIVFAVEGDTLYSAVDRKPKRSTTLRRIENARARPEVTVLVDHYDDDWERLWWIRLRGRARVLDGGAEAERALDLLVDKYEQYRRDRPTTPVLAVEVLEWRGWG